MINTVWISISGPVESDPDPVLNCRIRLDRDQETGSCSTLMAKVKLCAHVMQLGQACLVPYYNVTICSWGRNFWPGVPRRGCNFWPGVHCWGGGTFGQIFRSPAFQVKCWNLMCDVPGDVGFSAARGLIPASRINETFVYFFPPHSSVFCASQTFTALTRSSKIRRFPKRREMPRTRRSAMQARKEYLSLNCTEHKSLNTMDLIERGSPTTKNALHLKNGRFGRLSVATVY